MLMRTHLFFLTVQHLTSLPGPGELPTFQALGKNRVCPPPCLLEKTKTPKSPCPRARD